MQRAVITWMCLCVAGAAGALVEPRCSGADTRRCSFDGGNGTSHAYQFNVEGHNINIQYENSRFLELNCNGWAALDSTALPSFSDLLLVPRVTLTNCPPPDAGGSFVLKLLTLNVSLHRLPTQGNLTLMGLPPHPPLEAAHFTGLNDLIELKLINIGGNQPTPVAGFLAGLRRLRTLVVHGLQLPPGELNDLPSSLYSLSLRKVDFERPPQAVLELPNLRQLIISADKPLEFAIPQTLRSLSLDSVNTTFNEESMPTKLEYLSVVKWSKIPLMPLTRCQKLQTLVLTSPVAQALPSGWVALCANLMVLHVSYANITSLPADLLENATALQDLSFTYGALETIPSGLLDHLPNLRKLDLTKNRLQTLPSGMFTATVALRELTLSRNLLTADVTYLLEGLYSLQTLALDHNRRLTDLCDQPLMEPTYSSLKNLINMRFLSLEKTSVTRICSDWREHMPFLCTLNLRNTKISKLESFDFRYTRDDTVKDAEVLLDGAPVRSVEYTEEEYKKSQIADASGAKVQLDEHSSLKCDCNMYWTRLAFFPANNSTRVPMRVTGLHCSDKRALQEVPPEDMWCPADVKCREARLPDSCRCSGRPEAGRRVLLRVQCEGAALTSVPKLNTLSYIDYALRLANNNITELHIADLPANWTELDVRNNSLKLVDAVVGRALVGSRRQLQLAGNPLECSCSTAPLLLALHSAGASASDLRSASCNGGGALRDASTVLCARVPLAAWLAFVLTTLLAVTASIVAYFAHPKHRILIKILLHRLGLLRLPPEPPAPENGFRFDAYICFSHKDEDIVHEIVEELEKGPNPYWFCVHYRNWVPGPLISEQIVDSMRVSRRTVVIVSKAYFKSNWTQAEFREAYTLGLRECTSRLVVILLEDPEKLPLDVVLQSYIKSNTYVLWGDNWFWRKLRHALGHPLSSLAQPTSPSHTAPLISLAAPQTRFITPTSLATSLVSPNIKTALSTEWAVPEDLLSDSSDTNESLSVAREDFDAYATSHPVRKQERGYPSLTTSLPCRPLVSVAM